MIFNDFIYFIIYLFHLIYLKTIGLLYMPFSRYVWYADDFKSIKKTPINIAVHAYVFRS